MVSMHTGAVLPHIFTVKMYAGVISVCGKMILGSLNFFINHQKSLFFGKKWSFLGVLAVLSVAKMKLADHEMVPVIDRTILSSHGIIPAIANAALAVAKMKLGSHKTIPAIAKMKLADHEKVPVIAKTILASGC